MSYVYYGSIKISIIYYLFAAIISFVVGVYCYRRSKSGIKVLLTVLLAAYMFLILSTTVLARPVHTDYQYMLLPFWSYGAILEGRTDLLIENIANVIMLVPVGSLLPIVIRLNGKKTILIGFLFSLSVELLQLRLKRGLFEFDDMIHNTVGCLLGYVIIRFITEKKISCC